MKSADETSSFSFDSRYGFNSKEMAVWLALPSMPFLVGEKYKHDLSSSLLKMCPIS